MNRPTSLAAGIRAFEPGRRITALWTAGELTALLDDQAAQLRERELRPGEAVGLPLRNGDDWILALLSLLEAGARPVLIAPEAPPAERDRIMRQAGAVRRMEAGASPGSPRLVGEPGPRSERPEHTGVLLTTSGSTGTPQLILRSEASLLAEADRYVDTLGLSGDDQILLPVPLHHAYALGWLAAALRSGSEAIALPPTDLNATAARLREGADVIALVPALARLIAMRESRRPSTAPAPKLRIAMVGAGPVDAGLDGLWREAFGIATARNYGSTETGAVFAGLPPQPPLCVGQPMSGIDFEVVDEQGHICPPGTSGTLRVRSKAEADWHDMGDLVTFADDRLTVLGRRGQAIRRGGQWVSPLHIEAVLREHPEVLDVSVSARPGRHPGEDVLIAEVAVADPAKVDPNTLAAYARGQLEPWSVPHEFRVRGHIARGGSGKVPAPRRYVAAGYDALLDAARAYRRSELVFALHDSGILGRLGRPTTAAEVATALGLATDEVDLLLSIAAALGIVTDAVGDVGEPAPGAIEPLLDLESLLSRSLLDRTALIDVLRNGIGRRAFDRSAAEPQLITAYARAMDDEAARRRAALGVRLIRNRPCRRVLELSAGPGRYLAKLLAADDEATGCLVRIGRLAGPVDPVVAEAVRTGRVELAEQPPAETFDLCVVANGVHGPAPGGDLRALFERADPAGTVLIDDVFRPAEGGPGSEIGLDWLTHGAAAWPHAHQVVAEIEAMGWAVAVDRRIGSSGCHLILATGASNV